jgi:hypothetical protein
MLLRCRRPSVLEKQSIFTDAITLQCGILTKGILLKFGMYISCICAYHGTTQNCVIMTRHRHKISRYVMKANLFLISFRVYSNLKKGNYMVIKQVSEIVE